jgi:hypothetical protein
MGWLALVLYGEWMHMPSGAPVALTRLMMMKAMI